MLVIIFFNVIVKKTIKRISNRMIAIIYPYESFKDTQAPTHLLLQKTERAQTKSRKRPKKPNPFPIWAGSGNVLRHVAHSRPFLLYSPIHNHIPATNLLSLYG